MKLPASGSQGEADFFSRWKKSNLRPNQNFDGLQNILRWTFARGAKNWFWSSQNSVSDSSKFITPKQKWSKPTINWCRLVELHRLTSNTRKREERERGGGDDPDILVLVLIDGDVGIAWYCLVDLIRMYLVTTSNLIFSCHHTSTSALFCQVKGASQSQGGVVETFYRVSSK